MTRHEGARVGRDVAAVGACRFCLVGLGEGHLVTSFTGVTPPQHGREHHPERAFAASLGLDARTESLAR